MNVELYRKLKRLLLAGESPRLESSLAEPDRQRLVWAEGSMGEEISGGKFIQTLTAPVRLVICGGGHVARALSVAATQVGFAVTVLEDREEMLQPDYFPAGTQLCWSSYPRLIAENYGPNPFFAIMTRGHEMDQVCLEAVLKRNYGYVGVMGSHRKAELTRQRLAGAGVPQSVIDAIHTPIGLAIGAETPAEIAVSITAELIQCRKALGLEAPLDAAVIDALDKPPYAMVTLVDCQGSTPRGEGARMLVFPDGSTKGTVGGGLFEASAIVQGRRILAADDPAMCFSFQMDGSSGSVCGGVVTYTIVPVKEAASC